MAFTPWREEQGVSLGLLLNTLAFVHTVSEGEGKFLCTLNGFGFTLLSRDPIVNISLSTDAKRAVESTLLVAQAAGCSSQKEDDVLCAVCCCQSTHVTY